MPTPRFRVAAASLIAASTARAQVTRIVVDSVVSPAFAGASYGAAGQYETIAGRAFGELDPSDRRNRIITDLQFAPRNARGRVEYVATFFIVINPLLDYDFGPGFDRADGSGVPSIMPPLVKRAIPMKVAKVDADGNEIGGVPVVLRDAPLGTYIGWNITASGFYAGRLCSYAAGMIPFTATREERLAGGDPPLSLEERYKDHAGYVEAVRRAAANAVQRGFLLPADAAALVAAAEASSVHR